MSKSISLLFLPFFIFPCVLERWRPTVYRFYCILSPFLDSTVLWLLYPGPQVPVCRQKPFHPQFRSFIPVQLKKIPSPTQSLLQVRFVISYLLRYSVAYSLDAREGSLGVFLILLSGLGQSMKVHASFSVPCSTCTEHISPCYHTRCPQFTVCAHSHAQQPVALALAIVRGICAVVSF